MAWRQILHMWYLSSCWHQHHFQFTPKTNEFQICWHNWAVCAIIHITGKVMQRRPMESVCRIWWFKQELGRDIVDRVQGALRCRGFFSSDQWPWLSPPSPPSPSSTPSPPSPQAIPSPDVQMLKGLTYKDNPSIVQWVGWIAWQVVFRTWRAFAILVMFPAPPVNCVQQQSELIHVRPEAQYATPTCPKTHPYTPTVSQFCAQFCVHVSKKPNMQWPRYPNPPTHPSTPEGITLIFIHDTFENFHFALFSLLDAVGNILKIVVGVLSSAQDVWNENWDTLKNLSFVSFAFVSRQLLQRNTDPVR